MYAIKFTPRGERDLKKLSSHIKKRIYDKLLVYSSWENPLLSARLLVNLPPATHRYRIGKYRVAFYVAEQTIFVERIELSGQAYRK